MKYYDIASVIVEDDGEPHTINCYSVRQSERKEPAVNNRMWKMLVAERRSRKLAVDLGTRGFEHKIMETCAAKKMCAEKFAERRNGGSESEQRVPRDVAIYGRVGLVAREAAAEQDGATKRAVRMVGQN